MQAKRLLTVFVCSIHLWAVAPCVGDESADAPVIVKADSGARGGQVNLEALPAPATTNSLKKQLTIASLENVTSAEVLIFGALRDPTDRDSYAFHTWEWIFFKLNGHEWVVRVEDMPMHRRSLFEVDWADVYWASIPIPNVNYLKAGVNELVIWNNNLPEHRKNKYLVVAYDDSGQSAQSFSKVKDQWASDDLNGARDGTPVGEWMIRLKLNRLPAEAQKRFDALGAARYRKAVEGKKQFVWGFTDPMQRVFPDRPYTGPLGNDWQIDAARNEYESCQLVLVPVAMDMRMTEVFVGQFTRADGAVIAADATTVRLVRTARADDKRWPDALPAAYPTDIARGQVQSFWITVHVPADTPAGEYQAQVTITSMSTGGRVGEVTKAPLALRVRSFALPAMSRYQMVAPANPQMRAYQIANCQYLRPNPTPKVYLDGEGNLQLEFDDFDPQIESLLAAGVDNFSVGLAYTGAGGFTPECFDWLVDVEGQEERRRIWVCPVDPHNPPGREDASFPQSRKWFTQYLSQFYEHLEAQGWTQYWWLYGADEPHGGKWTVPLTNYFALIKKIAPNLRIMITRGPTDNYGPHVDIACIMMNHLRQDTIESARKLNQELWTYSAGHLNNPALTIHQPPITIRLWHWLQEKWGVRRVLLWNTMVYGRNFDQAGSDRRGDGQLFWIRMTPDGKEQFFPSVRVAMLRDGVEDREYLFLLGQLTDKLAAAARTDAKHQLLAEARALAEIPDELVQTQWQMTRDADMLLERRAAIADMIERLQAAP